MILHATFALSGPLKHCYGTIQADSELTARKYLRFHFPNDWASIYRDTEFYGHPESLNLRKIFEIDLNSQVSLHPIQKECE